MANRDMNAVIVGMCIGIATIESFIIFSFIFRSHLDEEKTTLAYRNFILSIWLVSVLLIYRRLPVLRWVQALSEQ